MTPYIILLIRQQFESIFYYHMQAEITTQSPYHQNPYLESLMSLKTQKIQDFETYKTGIQQAVRLQLSQADSEEKNRVISEIIHEILSFILNKHQTISDPLISKEVLKIHIDILKFLIDIVFQYEGTVLGFNILLKIANSQYPLYKDDAQKISKNSLQQKNISLFESIMHHLYKHKQQVTKMLNKRKQLPLEIYLNLVLISIKIPDLVQKQLLEILKKQLPVYAQQNMKTAFMEGKAQLLECLQQIIPEKSLEVNITYIYQTLLNGNLMKQLGAINLLSKIIEKKRHLNTLLQQYFTKLPIEKTIFNRNNHEQIIITSTIFLEWLFQNTIPMHTLQIWNFIAEKDKRISVACLKVLNQTIIRKKLSKECLKNILTYLLKMDFDINYINEIYITILKNLCLLSESINTQLSQNVLNMIHQIQCLILNSNADIFVLIQNQLIFMIENNYNCQFNLQLLIDLLSQQINKLNQAEIENKLVLMVGIFNSINQKSTKIQQFLRLINSQDIFQSLFRFIKNDKTFEISLRVYLKIIHFTQISNRKTEQILKFFFSKGKNFVSHSRFVNFLFNLIRNQHRFSQKLIIFFESKTKMMVQLFSQITINGLNLLKEILLKVNVKKNKCILVQLSNRNSTDWLLLVDPWQFIGWQFLFQLLLSIQNEEVKNQVLILIAELLVNVNQRLIATIQFQSKHLQFLFKELRKSQSLQKKLIIFKLIEQIIFLCDKLPQRFYRVPHKCSLKGQVIQLPVAIHDLNYYFELKIHVSTEYVISHFIQLIAQKLEKSSSSLKLSINNKKIQSKSYNKSLKQFLTVQSKIVVIVERHPALMFDFCIVQSILKQKFFSKKNENISHAEVYFLKKNTQKQKSYTLNELTAEVYSLFKCQPEKILKVFERLNESQKQFTISRSISYRQALASQFFYKILFELLDNQEEQIRKWSYNLLQLIPPNQSLFIELRLYDPTLLNKFKLLERSQKLTYVLELIYIKFSKQDKYFQTFLTQSGFQTIMIYISQILQKMKHNTTKANQQFLFNRTLKQLIEMINLFVKVGFALYGRKHTFLTENFNFLKANFEQISNKIQNLRNPQYYTKFNELSLVMKIAMHFSIQPSQYPFSIIDLNAIDQVFNSLVDSFYSNSSNQNLINQMSSFIFHMQIQIGIKQHIVSKMVQYLKSQVALLSKLSSNLLFSWFLYTEQDSIKTNILSQLFKNLPKRGEKQIINHYLLFSIFIEKYFDNSPQSSSLLTLIDNIIQLLMSHIFSENQDKADYVLQGYYILMKSIFKCSKPLKKKYGHFIVQFTLSNFLTFDPQQIKYENCMNFETRKIIYELSAELLQQIDSIDTNELFKKIISAVDKVARVDCLVKKPFYRLGLKNPSNICYLNSMIQLLFSIKPFVYTVCYTKTQDPLILELQKIFTHLQFSQRPYYDLTQILNKFDPPINPAIQQDTSEFFAKLIDRLQQNQTIKKIIQYLFEGTNLVKMKCSQCGRIIQVEEKFFFLSLQADRVSNLFQAFRRAEEAQHIVGFKCQNCGKTAECQKWSTIHKLPNILIIHLKRLLFDYQKLQNKKIHSIIQFPDQFTLNQHLQNFQLKGVTIHCGTGEAGHYIATCKADGNLKNQWFYLDDSRVGICQKSDLQQTWYGVKTAGSTAFSDNAYLLMYQKKQKPIIKDIINGRQIVYSQFPVFSQSQTLKEIKKQNIALIARTNFYGDKYMQDFINFCSVLVVLPSNNKILKIYQLLAKVLYQAPQEIKVHIDMKNIKDQDYSTPFEYLMNYQQYNMFLLFHKSRLVCYIMADMMVNILLNVQRQLALAYFSTLLEENPTQENRRFLRSWGYFSVISDLLTNAEQLFVGQVREKIIKMSKNIIAMITSSEIKISAQNCEIYDKAIQLLNRIKVSTKNSMIDSNESQNQLSTQFFQKAINYIGNTNLIIQLLQINEYSCIQPFFCAYINIIQSQNFLKEKQVSENCTKLLDNIFNEDDLQKNFLLFFGSTFFVISREFNLKHSLHERSFQFYQPKHKESFIEILSRHAQYIINPNTKKIKQYCNIVEAILKYLLAAIINIRKRNYLCQLLSQLPSPNPMNANFLNFLLKIIEKIQNDPILMNTKSIDESTQKLKKQIGEIKIQKAQGIHYTVYGQFLPNKYKHKIILQHELFEIVEVLFEIYHWRVTQNTLQSILNADGSISKQMLKDERAQHLFLKNQTMQMQNTNETNMTDIQIYQPKQMQIEKLQFPTGKLTKSLKQIVIMKKTQEKINLLLKMNIKKTNNYIGVMHEQLFNITVEDNQGYKFYLTKKQPEKQWGSMIEFQVLQINKKPQKKFSMLEQEMM